LSNNNTPSTPAARWQNITSLVANAGHVTIGHIAHIECAAIAADEHTVFATVVRREGESVAELLQRLDEAIGRALYEGVFTNEVEGGHFVLATTKRR
jgi:hypothetical protein